MHIITVRLITESGIIPEYKTDGAAGVDLMSTEECVISSGKTHLVSTGLFLEIPKGVEAQVRPRSGLAVKNGVTVLNSPGTIDSDYRGEIKVILINHGQDDFYIKVGDRIAQMIFAPVLIADFEIVQTLDSTERGGGGFGHTGV